MLKKRNMNKSGISRTWKLIIIILGLVLAIGLIFLLITQFESNTLESQADELDEKAEEKRELADELEKNATKLEGEADELDEQADETKIKKLREEASAFRDKADKLNEEASELEKEADDKLKEAAKALETSAAKLKEQASALRDKTGTRWKDADIKGKAVIVKERTIEVFTKTIPSYTKKFLGFEEWGSIDHYFITYLFVGFLAGFWMWLGAFIKNTVSKVKEGVMYSKKGTKLSKKIAISKGTWLDLIAGSFWKIPIIGIGYAIIMRVPIIMRIIQVITFDVLGLGLFFRSIVIAFYIGFLPTWIEQYARYRMRMKYYKKIQEVKYGAKIARSLSSG